MNSLNSLEGVENDFVTTEDGKLHQFMVKTANGPFRCDCGCNVFHKRVGEENRYICNSCDAEFVGS